MKKLVLYLSAGFAGMDAYEYWQFDDSITQNELDNFCEQKARDHAEMYGIYPESEREAYEDEEADIDENNFSDNIEGHFEAYDPAKHYEDNICWNK